MRSIQSLLTPVLALVPLLFAPPADASSGRIEISQAAALAGGVTPADEPGFPVTLDRSGSYLLTENLAVASSASAIEIRGALVQLDLGGFTISGPVTCTANPGATRASCSGAGGIGVDGAHAAVRAVSLRNGSIRGFSVGVDLRAPGESQSSFARIARLSVSHSGPAAITAGILLDRGIIADSNVSSLDGGGIAIGEISSLQGQVGAIVVDSTLRQTAHGIQVWQPSVVYGSTFDTIEGSGIIGAGGVFSHNLMRRTGRELVSGWFGAGVSIGSGSQYAVVSDNRIFEAGVGIRDLSSPGASTVYRNVIRGSTSFGLYLDSQTNFVWNHLLNNNGSSSNQQVRGGVPQAAGNWCGTNDPNSSGCYNND